MLESRLDMERALEFKARVEDVIDGGATQIVLDMSEVTYMDSSGLGTVVSVFKRMPSGGFHVTGLRPNVRTLFQSLGSTGSSTCTPPSTRRWRVSAGPDAPGHRRSSCLRGS